MKMTCVAVVEDAQQRANLCECVKIIGGSPEVDGKTVYVDYSGPQNTAEKFKELFSQYPISGCSSIS